MKKKTERGTQVQKGNMAMNKYLSITTLNVKGLNTPIKRNRVAEWIRKHDHTYAAHQRPSSEQKTYTD